MGRVDSNQGFLNLTGAEVLGGTVISGSSLGLRNLCLPEERLPGLVWDLPWRGCSVGASSEPLGLCGSEGASASLSNVEGVEVTCTPVCPFAPRRWEAWSAQCMVLFRVKNGYQSLLSLHSGPQK